MRRKQNEAKEKRNGRNGKQGGGTARRKEKGKDAGGNKKSFTAASKECVTEHG